ncbi:hypothetical protein BGZ54_005816 [Gamsiella multidivaricata]|nr:hypothetical protein BGZ54_005816 [Gamsiella multidivaricata]
MRGIPVAFLLTEDKTSASLQLWLMELKSLVGGFRYITTDDAGVERYAIEGAFGDSVKIHLCPWHVARAWSKSIRPLVKGPSPKESDVIRKQARNTLHSIMYESDQARAHEMIEEMRQGWAGYPEFIAYLNKNYFQSEERLKVWMKAYRDDAYYASMDTNNFGKLAQPPQGWIPPKAS